MYCKKGVAEKGVAERKLRETSCGKTNCGELELKVGKNILIGNSTYKSKYWLKFVLVAIIFGIREEIKILHSSSIDQIEYVKEYAT